MKMSKENWMKVAAAFYDGEEIECKSDNDKGWETSKGWSLSKGYVYRLKPVAPSIDWDAVSSKFTWLATNQNGKSFLRGCSEKKWTDEKNGVWQHNSEHVQTVFVFSSFTPGNCDWKESLVRRPATEPKEISAPEMEECGMCKGSGTINWTSYNHGAEYFNSKPCDNCDATGKLKTEVKSHE